MLLAQYSTVTQSTFSMKPQLNRVVLFEEWV